MYYAYAFDFTCRGGGSFGHGNGNGKKVVVEDVLSDFVTSGLVIILIISVIFLLAS